MLYFDNQSGLLELICGCMFAGKTEELMRRVNVLRLGRKKVGVFKPQFDQRKLKNSATDYIQSHGKRILKAHIITNLAQLKQIVDQQAYDVLCFDEVQFFPPEFAYYIETQAQQGKHVICAGLDKGFNDEVFPTIMLLLTFAEVVTKLYAVCFLCGGLASKTQRINQQQQPIAPSEVENVIGGADVYQARCRKCFVFFPVLDDIRTAKL